MEAAAEVDALLGAFAVLVRANDRAPAVLRRAMRELLAEDDAPPAPAAPRVAKVIETPRKATPAKPAKAKPVAPVLPSTSGLSVSVWMALRHHAEAKMKAEGLTWRTLGPLIGYGSTTTQATIQRRQPPSAAFAAKLRQFVDGTLPEPETVPAVTNGADRFPGAPAHV